MYDSEQYELARDYLRRRIENEVSMTEDVERLLDEYAAMFIDLFYSMDLRDALSLSSDIVGNADVRLLIEDLVSRLLEDCRLLAVDEHVDMRDGILDFIGREWKGDTLEGRVRSRVLTMFDELCAICIAGIGVGMGRGVVESAFVMNKKQPWQNPVLSMAHEKISAGDASFLGFVMSLGLSLDYFDERHYGQGVPISSFTALTDITVFAIAEGWGYYDYMTHKDGSRGYFVVRGSSYPCEECDSHVGFHPIGDEENLPMYHNHCRCMTIWV